MEFMPKMPQPNKGPDLGIPIPTLTPKTVHIKASEHEFVEPKKIIYDESHIKPWLYSEGYSRLLKFIQRLNVSVKNKKITDPCNVSENVQKTLDLLQQLEKWIEEIPPIESQFQRFGNRAFKIWIERLETCSYDLIKDMLPEEMKNAAVEVTPYFTGGFGNGIRIDYGSGHELSFVAFLCCLDLIDFYTEEDYEAVVHKVLVKYLDIVRNIQSTYSLEPAGSHGVWGLDDFQFLPYYFGSAELENHKRIKPKSILQKDTVEYFSKDYMYLACIQFIYKMKKGPFYEHSPMLYDISGVQSWDKINAGMLKMYVCEVLKKVPIVQHFLFGSLISFNESEEKPILATMVGAASSIAPTSSSIGSIGMGPGLSSTSTVLPSTSYYTSHRSINQLKNRYS